MTVHSLKDGKPPCGVPLIVRIKQDWEKNYKVLSPVYYLKSHYDGSYGFYEYGIGQEDHRIGPDSVEVINWMRYPTPDELMDEVDE